MKRNVFPEQRLIGIIYRLVIFGMCLTGFGQMPIFKRYYIADIPGLAWLADYYFTHIIHYLGAILLFVIFAYCATFFFLVGRHGYKLTFSAYVRIVLLSAITITGIFRVMKNLPNVVFSPDFTMFIDISHLGFMMIFLMVSAGFLIFKSRWLIEKSTA